MKNTNKLLLCTVIVSAMGFANAGDFVGVSSGSPIIVGESTIDAGPHTSGKAGLGVTSAFGAATVDIAGLSNFANSSENRGTTVYRLDNPITAANHNGMGNFSFTQVGDADVWVGEWSKSGDSAGYEDRKVFYVGDHSGATMPRGGKASYTVHGVNHYETASLYKGTLNADFSANTLSGFMSDGPGYVSIDADINASAASFSGTADSVGTYGVTNGHFFGNNAASLAGVATFETVPGLDTAFGGTKD